ncbi:hypothetical protein [Tenacibaculum soleae]|uniref:hypothetical protein n=1 Tax=Tenacibaculum soleae TaxID=447689 RepID=UPI0023009787|nr:hypothetical protein [Tenacibaculum soleae]
MMKFIKKNALLVIGGLILIFVFVKSLLFNLVGVQYSPPLDVGNGAVSDNLAKQYASILYVAMGSIGTDFGAILEVFKSINEQSYYKVYNAFGDKGYMDVIGVGIDILWPKKLNLTEWLRSELTSNQLVELKKVANYLPF